jgi:hypothetical protein
MKKQWSFAELTGRFCRTCLSCILTLRLDFIAPSL